MSYTSQDVRALLRKVHRSQSADWDRLFVLGLAQELNFFPELSSEQIAVFERIQKGTLVPKNGTLSAEKGTKGTERLARVRKSEHCSVPIYVPFCPKSVPLCSDLVLKLSETLSGYKLQKAQEVFEFFLDHPGIELSQQEMLTTFRIGTKTLTAVVAALKAGHALERPCSFRLTEEWYAVEANDDNDKCFNGVNLPRKIFLLMQEHPSLDFTRAKLVEIFSCCNYYLSDALWLLKASGLVQNTLLYRIPR